MLMGSAMERRTGRPSKLRPQVLGVISRAIRGTDSLDEAAKVAGISGATLHAWCAQARAGDPRYLEFLDTVERAQAERRRAQLELAESGPVRVCVQLEQELERARERLVEAFRDEPQILARATAALFGVEHTAVTPER